MEPNTTTSSDEIDLGQLLQLIRKGLEGIFRAILRVFRYLKRNIIKLVALIIIGVGIGLFLNSFVDDKLQTEAIVKPNFESKDYLYDAVEELQSSILAKDSIFFNALGINLGQMQNYSIEVEPIQEEVEIDKELAEEENEYLEILKNYKENEYVLDIVKSKILKKSVVTHRITLTHKNPEKGEEYVAKILDYINSNSYFTELQQVNSKNAKSRIDKNEELIRQIDLLVSNFSESLNSGPNQDNQGMLVKNENATDISSLLSLKNKLTKEVEQKRIELAEQNKPISILNLGKTHVVKKLFFNKNIVLTPVLLLGLFFIVSLISYLNRKSIEIQ